MAKTLRKEETFSFPRGPMTLALAAKEAESALTADYMADVNGIAIELKAQLDRKMLTAEGTLAGAVDKTVKESPRVKYSRKAMMGLIVSENIDAAFDEGFEFSRRDEEVPWSDLMFHAMRQDVVNALDAAGVDISHLDFDDDGDEGEEEDDEDGEDGE